jgi:hypothetical protein
MNRIFRLVATATLLILVSACTTTYEGDNLLKLPEQPVAHDQTRLISKTRSDVSNMLNALNLPEERKKNFENVSPTVVVHDNQPLDLNQIDDQLIVSRAYANIAFASNSIIISDGALHISHSGNNVIICGGDVDISHDGSEGNGSLVISRGRVKISHARNSLIYALHGVEISHASNVQAFNTHERKTSWGHISNILVKPLFSDEITASPPPQQQP